MGNRESNTRSIPRSAYPSQPSTIAYTSYSSFNEPEPFNENYRSEAIRAARAAQAARAARAAQAAQAEQAVRAARAAQAALASQAAQSSNSCSETPRNETDVNINEKENVSSKVVKTLNKRPLLAPPAVFKDEKDFYQNWPTWKEQFVSYVKCLDEDSAKATNTLGYLFLNLMGPVGQNLRKKIIFNNKEEEGLSTLIQKYDNFHSLYSRTKTNSESIEEYLNNKKEQFLSQKVIDIDEELRKIIVMNINNSCKIRFTTIACSFLPKFLFTPTLQSLTLKEIIFLWELSEESASKKPLEQFNANKECIYCGRFHERGRCPAWGKECNKCNKRNHFANKCPPEIYVNDCNFCGGRHVVKKCPAFGEKCTICDHLNHFSWKCQTHTYIKNCKFCGLGHNATKSECAARNSFCSICKTVGHFEVKCQSNNVNSK